MGCFRCYMCLEEFGYDYFIGVPHECEKDKVKDRIKKLNQENYELRESLCNIQNEIYALLSESLPTDSTTTFTIDKGLLEKLYNIAKCRNDLYFGIDINDFAHRWLKMHNTLSCVHNLFSSSRVADSIKNALERLYMHYIDAKVVLGSKDLDYSPEDIIKQIKDIKEIKETK